MCLYQQKQFQQKNFQLGMQPEKFQPKICLNVQCQVNKAIKNKKLSFCRFFLRGLCIKSAKECDFSHGVQDLNYTFWNGEEVQYDYLKDTDFTQKNSIKGNCIYKNLYEFQKQKIFTLKQLNQERGKRILVRQEMHRQLYYQFMQLLEYYYPEANFTEQFLLREYTRVGFNKLMTRIKFSHLISFLCQLPQSNYYREALIMPPLAKRNQNYIFKLAPEYQINQFYRQKYQLLSKKQENIDQSVLKKYLYNCTRSSLSIPPLYWLLKTNKKSFNFFLKQLSSENKNININFQASTDILLESAMKYLQIQCTCKLVSWNDVYLHLSKKHQLNNGNVINQIKPTLVQQHYLFLFFPMVQIIIPSQLKIQPKLETIMICPCPFKQPCPKQELLSLCIDPNISLIAKQTIDINNFSSLIQSIPSILGSKILGVDLQGKLRKNGYIEMIQLNNEINTFLIDIYQMDLNGDIQTFQLTKKVIRHIMVDKNIVKIFHDCRHDSLALHQFMQTCICNVFDTSAVQTYKNQLQAYNKLYNSNCSIKECISVFNECKNVRTAGLNQILKKYNAPHGINKNKTKFHSMWKNGETSLFDQRPLDPAYRQYCIMDVLDLPYLHDKMTQKNEQIAELITKTFAYSLAIWLSQQYSRNGYLMIHS